ncbi:MAG: Rz-like lysis system protein LysB [Burkholderia gladioli]
MRAILVKVIGVAAVLLAICAAVQYVRALRADLVDARNGADSARRDVAQRDTTIATLRHDADENARRQRELDAKRSAVEAKRNTIQASTRRILHENPEARAWADTPLPTDIARLQASPALTGAGDYLQRMPDGEPLSTAGHDADNQR